MMTHLKIAFLFSLALLTIFTSCESKEAQEKRSAEKVKEELNAEENKKEMTALHQNNEIQNEKPALKEVKGAITVKELTAEFEDKEVSVTGFFEGINKHTSDENQVSISLGIGNGLSFFLAQIPKAEWEKENYDALRKNEEDFVQKNSLNRTPLQITLKGKYNGTYLLEATLVAYED
ncbi:hypothetical protein [Hugenholtzia roseola]|uniref:hypothetical protein n=1 Tax=Hugenholtzia roseola TaxID=1002 RepID=UPI0012B53E17|nr:hypothetical protein [Hugenholtzia roseola]